MAKAEPPPDGEAGSPSAGAVQQPQQSDKGRNQEHHQVERR
jgi:hypothetical protein